MSDISHKIAQQYILAAADDLLGEAELQRMKQHLSRCEQCRLFAFELDRLSRQIQRSFETRWGSRLARGVRLAGKADLARLTRQARRRETMGHSTRRVATFAGLIVLAVIAWLAGSYWIGRYRESLATGLPPVADAGEQVITFAAAESARPVYEPLIEAFNATQPGFRVQLAPVEPETFASPAGLQGLASAADTAALTLAFRQDDPRGYFLDLVPLLEADPDYDREDFWPDILEGCSASGQSLGLPLSAAPQLIFFQKDAFESAGIPAPVPGWTFEEFQAAARQLAQPGQGGGARFGFAPLGEAGQLLSPLSDSAIQQAGGEYDPEKLAEALGWYVALAGEGAVPGTPEQGDWTERDDQLVQAGQVGMWIDTLFNLDWRRSSLGSLVSAAPFPVSADGSLERANPAAVLCATISAGSQHRQQAWEWIKFLSDHALGQDEFSIPARPSLAEDSVAWKNADQEIRAAISYAMNHGWYGSQFPAAQAAVAQALAQALTGQAELAGELAALAPAPEQERPAPAPTPVSVATPLPDPAEGKITVSFYGSGWIHPDPRLMADLAEEFNRQHPEIEVQATMNLPVPAGESIDLTGMADKVDCLSWPYTPPEDAGNLFYSLDDFLAMDDPLNAGSFNPQALDAFRVGGALYGLPATSLPLVIYYNPDLLAEAGLAAPGEDWTFVEFLDLAAAASRSKDGKPVYGFVPYQADYTTFLLAGRGVNWYDPERDPSVLPYDDPEIVNAALWLRELSAAGVMPAQFGIDTSPQRERLVNQGQAALWTQFAFLTPGYDPIEQGFQAWVAPPPQVPGLLPAPSTSALYISRKTAYPQVCWEWFAFLSKNPSTFQGIPANLEVVQSQEWENLLSAGEGLPSLAAVYRSAADRPSLSRGPDFYLNNWLTEALAAVISGEDAPITLAEAQAKVERYQACLEAEEVQALTNERRSQCAEQAGP